MPRKRFTNEQIAFALRQAENGATVDEVCRKMGVSEPTFYRWKKQFVGMGVPEIRRLNSLGARRAVRSALERSYTLKIGDSIYEVDSATECQLMGKRRSL